LRDQAVFHASGCSHKKDFSIVTGLELTRNCKRRDHMSASASACYQNPHAIAAPRLNVFSILAEDG
jgi:hypothetical protein